MPAELKSLGQKYGDFYAPAFAVKADGQDLVRDYILAITSVEVDLKLNASSRFSFTISNSFDWEAGTFVGKKAKEEIDLLNLFKFERGIEIYMGYGDSTKLALMMHGVVTEVSTSFTEGASPELRISGYDRLFLISTGAHTRSWEKKRDSDAVYDLVAGLGLSNDIKKVGPERGRIDQNQENNLAFLGRLAQANAATFYVDKKRFYFGPSNNDKAGAIGLKWGQGLLSFSPQSNLAKQVKSVEVFGWSPERGTVVKGVAGKDDLRGRASKKEHASKWLSSVQGNDSHLRVRAAVRTELEAAELAKATLDKKSLRFLTGEGESIGLPELVPDVNVTLQGLGRVFNLTYYVVSARHTLDTNGYRTSFGVQEPTL